MWIILLSPLYIVLAHSLFSLMKSCCVCSKDSSPYKCPKCSSAYCSVACCKAHKEACSTSVIVDDTETEETLRIPPVHTPDKLSSSTRLQEFLALNPYLQAQLPVLLARIDRAEPAFTLQAGSELARELERKERVGSVLREAVDTDPIVGELYKILQEENLI